MLPSVSRVVVLAVVASLAAAPATTAATRFGNRFASGPNVTWTCASGVPNARQPVALGFLPPFIPGSGVSSCAFLGVQAAGSGFYAPGTGRITRVRVPAVRVPGRMRPVVFRAVTAIASDGRRTTACCTVERLGPVFRSRRGRSTSVRTNLRVQVDSPAQEPGAVAGADVLGIAVLDPRASLPLLDGRSDDVAFNAYLWHPAPRRATSEIATPPYVAGYAVLLNADWVPARRRR